jgi:hypothetical protein
MSFTEATIEYTALSCLDAMDFMMFCDVDIALGEPGARLILEHTP